MFEKKGVIVLTPKPESDKQFDDVFDLALEYGAEDVQEGESEDGKEWEVRHVRHLPVSRDLTEISTRFTSPLHYSATLQPNYQHHRMITITLSVHLSYRSFLRIH